MEMRSGSRAHPLTGKAPQKGACWDYRNTCPGVQATALAPKASSLLLERGLS